MPRPTRARVQRPGNPATAREKYWAAHEKITVRRGTLAPAAPSRPAAEPVDLDDVEALRKELGVAIDIDPGTFPDVINLRSGGHMEVAILSTLEFVAPREVDSGSLTFGRSGRELEHPRVNLVTLTATASMTSFVTSES